MRRRFDRWLLSWHETGWECSQFGEKIPLRSLIAWYICQRYYPQEV